MHSFEVHSNESTCRNSGGLGLEQVKNNTRSKFQPEHTNGILQGVINVTGGKKAQNEFNR